MNKILTFILPWIENKQINKTLKNQMSTMSDINTILTNIMMMKIFTLKIKKLYLKNIIELWI